MKVVGIVQARMGSTRLPGKVLADIAGQPMLARVVNRAMRTKSISDVVVATTEHATDDAVVDLCKEWGWHSFRGSEEDVLDRYYQSALAFEADIIARITSDCPLIEAEIIDRVAGELLRRPQEVDYASNSLTRTFPRGLDVEVISFAALEKAWQQDRNPAWREHVTPYIWCHPERFKIRNVANEVDYSHMRWTVDTSDDLTFVRKIYGHFQNDTFTWRDVLSLLDGHPEWSQINQHVQQKVVP